MIINKIVKQNLEVLKKTLPDLMSSINAHLPELSDDSKGKVAGLIIEYVIKSEGSTDVLKDEEEPLFLEGNIDDNINWEELKDEL